MPTDMHGFPESDIPGDGTGKFDWIAKEWDALVGKNGEATIDVDQFLRRTGLYEGSDYLDAANQWGARQSPVIEFGETQDSIGVLIRRRK